MPRALWKTKDCFAQLLADLSQLELVSSDRVQYQDGSVAVPLAWAGQPVLLCLPAVPLYQAPTVDQANGRFRAALSLGELTGSSDIMRCLRRLDEVIRRRISVEVPELVTKAAGGQPYEGVVRCRSRGPPHMVVHWRRGSATLTSKSGMLLEPEDLCVDGAGETADARVIVTHVLIQKDGAARVHVAATELKRLRH